MAVVYLGFGSNLGNREDNIKQACQLLRENGLVIEKFSSMIETDPVGGPPQGKFINAVCKATTQLSPHQLLTLIHSIERKLGRVREVINGPRLIDIDILLYDQLKINEPDFKIPHPRMRERDFVMKPLYEIDPNLFNESN